MSNKENHCTQVDGIEGWKDPEGSTGPHMKIFQVTQTGQANNKK